MQYWLQLYVYRTQQTQGGPSVDCTDPVIKKSHWNCYTIPIRFLQSHMSQCQLKPRTTTDGEYPFSMMLFFSSRLHKVILSDPYYWRTVKFNNIFIDIHFLSFSSPPPVHHVPPPLLSFTMPIAIHPCSVLRFLSPSL